MKILILIFLLALTFETGFCKYLPYLPECKFVWLLVSVRLKFIHAIMNPHNSGLPVC